MADEVISVSEKKFVRKSSDNFTFSNNCSDGGPSAVIIFSDGTERIFPPGSSGGWDFDHECTIKKVVSEKDE